MSFQTFNLPSKSGPNTPKPSSRVPVGVAGQVADHQPCWLPTSVGQESPDKENAPLHEHGVQPSRPIATNNYLRVLTSASNNCGTVTAIAYSRVSPRKKVARPALLVPPSSASRSSPTEPRTLRPRRLVGKRSAPSDDFAEPSSPPKKARRVGEKGNRIDSSSRSGLSSGSTSRLIIPPPTRVSTRDIASSPQQSPEEDRQKTPELDLGRDNCIPIPKPGEQCEGSSVHSSEETPGISTEKTETANDESPSPSEDGDKNIEFRSDPSNARGGRENDSVATMAKRILEVHKLEDHYNDLMARLHPVDSVVDSFADDALEDDFAVVKAAFQAWQDAKLRLSSPASASPSTSATPGSTMSSPALNSVSGDYNRIGALRGPYLVLLAHLDSMLPHPPVLGTNPEVETLESAETHDEEPTNPDAPPSPLPSEDPQGEGLPPPASSTPPSEPTSVGIRSELPESEGVAPSASSTPPIPQASATSSSVGSTASAPFRFSGDGEALLLGHARAKRYTEATDMLPQDQRWQVITTPTAIAAVRLVHPKRTAKPSNKGKRTGSERNRETRSHIGEDGAETELWVCRASFKVDEVGIAYSGSPCGMPVGTKDSWKRHMKEKHLGREKRG